MSPSHTGIKQSTREGRILPLDGLRAVAVCLVLIAHGFDFGVPSHFLWWAPGQTGVRLFFVLSGFLITGILADARTQSERYGVPRSSVWFAFYTRRTLRIFPLVYLAIGVAFLFGVPAARESGWWYVAYLQNVHMARQGAFDSGLGHFWSLAVEEQFYVLWPVLLLWVPRPAVTRTVVGVVLAAGVIRGVMVAGGHETAAYVLSPSRFDALAFGGWLAWTGQTRRAIPVLATAGLILCGAGALMPHAVSAVLIEWGAIVFAGIAVMWASQASHGTALLTWRPVVYIGSISYGIYVWHNLVPAAVHFIEGWWDIWLRFPGPGLSRFVVVSVCATVIASLSWRWIEAPLNSLKRYVPYVPGVGSEEQQAIAPEATGNLTLMAEQAPVGPLST